MLVLKPNNRRGHFTPLAAGRIEAVTTKSIDGARELGGQVERQTDRPDSTYIPWRFVLGVARSKLVHVRGRVVLMVLSRWATARVAGHDPVGGTDLSDGVLHPRTLPEFDGNRQSDALLVI